MLPLILLAIVLLSLIAYVQCRQRAVAVADGRLARLHSRPSYHGLYSLLWVLMAGIGVFATVNIGLSNLFNGFLVAEIRAALPDAEPIEQALVLSDAIKLAAGRVASADDALRRAVAESVSTYTLWREVLVGVLGLLAASAAFWLTFKTVSLGFRARNRSERILRSALWIAAGIAILTTIGIVLSLIGETLVFFSRIGWEVDAFLFGTNWSPLAGVSAGALEPDKVGAVPLFVGTLTITVIAMLVAVPIGLFAAIYLADFASKRTRSWAKPLLEILAGVPTVVYGYFAAITVAPALRDAGAYFGLGIASESALAAGVVMGIMIIPFISSLSDDVINAVPQSLRDGSYGLGATKAETVRRVVLPAALPGIVSAVLLGTSRAIGETMIVVMAAGQSGNLPDAEEFYRLPIEALTTVTVQIVMLITGDTEADVAAAPAFTLGFTLFCVTLVLNVVALRVVRRYREMYD
ncbi:MAG: phosphate ABC transporter permease subunit PstC [Pseudomonadota bacterium]